VHRTLSLAECCAAEKVSKPDGSSLSTSSQTIGQAFYQAIACTNFRLWCKEHTADGFLCRAVQAIKVRVEERKKSSAGRVRVLKKQLADDLVAFKNAEVQVRTTAMLDSR
jgi:hypothetical protein